MFFRTYLLINIYLFLLLNTKYISYVHGESNKEINVDNHLLTKVPNMTTGNNAENTTDGPTEEIQFNKICFESENFCYHYSSKEIEFWDLSEVKGFCPAGSWLITALNQTIQEHLQMIISKMSENQELTNTILALQSSPKFLFWSFGNSSKIRVKYENWFNPDGLMGVNECAFMSEELEQKWRVGVCSGFTRIVCMSRFCTSSWEKVEGTEVMFEEGVRMSDIQSLEDCQLYCELLETSCIGVYMSQWDQCWVFSAISTSNSEKQQHTLHMKVSRSVCPSKAHKALDDKYNKWHSTTDVHNNPVKRAAAIGASGSTASVYSTPSGRGTKGKKKGGAKNDINWEEEPPGDKEQKSVLEKLHLVMTIITFGLVSVVVAIRIATWVVASLRKKKKVIEATEEKVAEN